MTTTQELATDITPNTVNVIQTSRTVASTGTTTEMWIVWHAHNIQCCDSQDGWEADSEVGVWDANGIGQWALLDTVQCGGCGQRVGPHARLLFAADEVEAAAEEVAAERKANVAELIAEIEARLRVELAEAIEDDEPTGSEMEPGAYIDGGIWVAWDFHPADNSDTITVTA